MSAPIPPRHINGDRHVWPPAGEAPVSCLVCGEPYSPLVWNERCVKAARHPQVIRARIEQLAADGRDLSVDMRAARDAAEPGAKAAYRYPLRHIEQAVAHIERAAK